jgi:hypothetical protein
MRRRQTRIRSRLHGLPQRQEPPVVTAFPGLIAHAVELMILGVAELKRYRGDAAILVKWTGKANLGSHPTSLDAARLSQCHNCSGDALRSKVCDAFRRASEANSAMDLLTQLIEWLRDELRQLDA